MNDKRRTGCRVQEVADKFKALLLECGATEDEAEKVEARLDAGPRYWVYLDGEVLGIYNYRERTLTLNATKINEGYSKVLIYVDEWRARFWGPRGSEALTTRIDLDRESMFKLLMQ